MSNYFGNGEKDNLMNEMVRFLEDHKVSELLEVVQAAVEYAEDE